MTVHHLIARGVHHIARNVPTHFSNGDNERTEIRISPFSTRMLVGTFFLYIFVSMAINYTYGVLIPNLVMNEAPGTTTVIKRTEYRDEVDESPDAPLLTKEEKESMQPRDEEVVIIAHKPVTAKLRTTLRHLREKTGSRLSRFRGVGGYLVYSSLKSYIVLAFTGMMMNRVSILSVPFTAALCVFSAAWVQQTLAMPGKSYVGRVGQLFYAGAFRKLFLPTLLVEAVELSIVSLPQNIMVLFDAVTPKERETHPAVYGALAAAVVFFTLIGITCAVIPLNIGLVRYQASLLAEEEETVIPIDRSLGEAGIKGVKAGWKSFSRRSLLTLIKTFVKFVMIQTAVSILFVIVFAFEIRYALGDNYDKIKERIEAYRQ